MINMNNFNGKLVLTKLDIDPKELNEWGYPSPDKFEFIGYFDGHGRYVVRWDREHNPVV
jgi:hypothetical protein